MPKAIDRTGVKYGHLLVLKEAEPVYGKGNVKYRRWLCRCDCGNESIYFAANITSGHSQSCRKCGHERTGKLKATHGKSSTRLYHMWAGMVSRCHSEANSAYCKYGAKGIYVCDEWRGENGFENFYDWAMSHGYKDAPEKYFCTIDRLDNSKGYSPDNCRIANAYVQANNRDYDVFVEDTDGERLTLKQLARKHDISYGTIHSRWMRGKRSAEDLTCLIKGNSGKGNRVARFTEYGGNLKTAM